MSDVEIPSVRCVGTNIPGLHTKTNTTWLFFLNDRMVTSSSFWMITDLPPWCVYRHPHFLLRSTGYHHEPQNRSEKQSKETYWWRKTRVCSRTHKVHTGEWSFPWGTDPVSADYITFLNSFTHYVVDRWPVCVSECDIKYSSKHGDVKRN